VDGALRETAPEAGGKFDATAMDRTLDAWVIAWRRLVDELLAARGRIDATLLARSRQAKDIRAGNPTLVLRHWLMDLDDYPDQRRFGDCRIAPAADGSALATFDDAWLAHWRAQERALAKLDPVDDWSGLPIPHAGPLAAIPMGPCETLADFLVSLRSAKPSKKWAARAREIARSRDGRRVKAAILRWLGTVPSGGAPATPTQLWADVADYRHFRRVVFEDALLTGSADAAALLAFFNPSVPLSPAPGDWLGLSRRTGQPAMLSDDAGRLVRGAAWMLANWRGGDVVETLRQTAEATLAPPLRGYSSGYRSLLAANACILALGEIASREAVQALGRIKLGARDERLSRQIATAMETAALRAGMTVEDLEEVSAPDFDLDGVGVKVLSLGEFSATLQVLSTTRVGVELAGADGRSVKAVPAAIKSDPPRRAALKRLSPRRSPRSSPFTGSGSRVSISRGDRGRCRSGASGSSITCSSARSRDA
jgi:hypothetical protein